MTDVEVVPADARPQIITGATPAAMLDNAQSVATDLAALIERQNLYTVVGRDRRTGEQRKHVEVGGWQAAGAMLGAIGGTPLTARTAWTRAMPRDDGLVVYESRCEIYALTGELVSAAESMCSSAESNWRNADEYAVRGMAETRAESRAWRRAIGWVVKLAGYNPTPAEEVPAEPAPAPAGARPDWAAPVGDISGVAQSLNRLLELAGVAENRAQVGSRIGQRILERCGEELPLIAWEVVNYIADAIASNDQQEAKP